MADLTCVACGLSTQPPDARENGAGDPLCASCWWSFQEKERAYEEAERAAMREMFRD